MTLPIFNPIPLSDEESDLLAPKLPELQEDVFQHVHEVLCNY